MSWANSEGRYASGRATIAAVRRTWLRPRLAAFAAAGVASEGSLKVVPNSRANLLLEVAEKRILVAKSVVIVQAGPQQMAAPLAAPRPARLQHEIAAVVQLLAQMAMSRDERRPRRIPVGLAGE